MNKEQIVGVSSILLLSACSQPKAPNPASAPATPAAMTQLEAQRAGSICQLSAAEQAVLSTPSYSAARQWNELTLHAIRNSPANATANARTLYHVSAAMYDAWASYDRTARGVFYLPKQAGSHTERNQAVQYAAATILQARYAKYPALVDCFAQHLRRQGLDPANRSVVGNSPAAVGNRIGRVILSFAATDGANEANNYADLSGYRSVNPTLNPFKAEIAYKDLNRWQPLIVNGKPQTFLTPHWKDVRPFALVRRGNTYHDAGPVPSVDDPHMKTQWLPDLMRRQAQMDAESTQTINISPRYMGNNSIGKNDGKGYAVNPVTGKPYADNVVPLADYGRAIAEYWGDAPALESPAGHWNLLANDVSYHPAFVRRIGGRGPMLGALEWDVKLYLALNGALHDAAISAWEVKRLADTSRPITLIRALGSQGELDVPDILEKRGDQWVAKSWQHDKNVVWNDVKGWMPYQARDFVTPPFPGFVSGHSTFCHAAAEVLSQLTGSPYFPLGLYEVPIAAGSLQYENAEHNIKQGFKLQWVSYYDAADEGGESRLWSGVHIEPDDLIGRKIGHQVGQSAVNVALSHFAGRLSLR